MIAHFIHTSQKFSFPALSTAYHPNPTPPANPAHKLKAKGNGPFVPAAQEPQRGATTGLPIVNMKNPNEPRTPTQAQIDANRRNAQKSTGPRTPDGKNTSSRNHIIHGLRSGKHLVLDEDPEDFLDLLKDLQDRFQPSGEAEQELVLRIASDQWRLHRAMPMEAGIYRRRLQDVAAADKQAQHYYDYQLRTGVKNAAAPPPVDKRDSLARAFVLDADKPNALAKFARYETGLSRSIDRSLRQLKIYQAARIASTLDLPQETQTGSRVTPVRCDPRPSPPPVPPAESPATSPQSANYHSNPKNAGIARFAPVVALFAVLALLHAFPAAMLSWSLAPIRSPACA